MRFPFAEMTPSFSLTLYDEHDEIVVVDLPSPVIPPAGTQLIVSQLASPGQEFCWEVTGVPQLHFPDPASWAARDGEPYHAELRVKPGKGIHDS